MFRDFILAKVINGMRAARKSPSFSRLFMLPRAETLCKMVDQYRKESAKISTLKKIRVSWAVGRSNGAMPSPQKERSSLTTSGGAPSLGDIGSGQDAIRVSRTSSSFIKSPSGSSAIGVSGRIIKKHSDGFINDSKASSFTTGFLSNRVDVAPSLLVQGHSRSFKDELSPPRHSFPNSLGGVLADDSLESSKSVFPLSSESKDSPGRTTLS
eukprot:TRINITY_DN11325_c0_g1_i1.p1 TRINITY_DN11325_c0_g1~~TRINITY_DN11325_c0_g1_i1.p1  ORF type:complete len:211 (-),score=49.32 TRINITY_DN11325_c0_g1_i1:24-656(-)